MSRLTASEISRRRSIEFIELKNGRGQIWAGNSVFNVAYDDLLDLTLAVETIMLRLTRKVLNKKFRPIIKNRNGLEVSKLIAGGMDKCNTDIPPGISAEHFYLLVEIEGNAWHNWFTRLDELVKMLYIIVKEAQGDEYKPSPRIWMGGACA